MGHFWIPIIEAYRNLETQKTIDTVEETIKKMMEINKHPPLADRCSPFKPLLILLMFYQARMPVPWKLRFQSLHL
jgi:hypothetical protein